MVSRDEMLEPAVWAKILAWATVIGLEFGLIGPFGSYPANMIHRMTFWVPVCWIGSILVWSGLVAALAIGTRHGFPPLFSGAVGLLVVCVPVAAIAATGVRLIWPIHASGMMAVEYYGLTLLVAGPATAAIVWILRLSGGGPRWATAGGGAAERTEPETVPAGLPDHLIETAICLQMEDHHVRIHLHGRSVLHLLPMAQAMAAIGEQRGIRVHRSWWVADRAVSGWAAEGRGLFLTLTNGLKVPVARSRVAAVRARGLIG